MGKGGGGAQGPSQTVQGYQTPDWLSGQATQATQDYGAMTQQAQKAAGQVNLQTDFSGQQYNPQLGQFTAQDPLQQTKLSPFFQQMVSQGQQSMANQAAAQRADINRQFQGQPGVANILGQQAAMQAQLQSNPLLAQAQQAQMGQMNQQNQLNLQAQQANNQAMLAQAANAMGTAQAGNQAQTQQLGMQMMPLQMQQGLLQTLAAMYPYLGQQVGTTAAPDAGTLIKLFQGSPFAPKQ